MRWPKGIDNLHVECDPLNALVPGGWHALNHDVCWAPHVYQDAWLVEYPSFLELGPEVGAFAEVEIAGR